MIAKASELIVEWLINIKEIDISDKELYQYALYSFFLTISPLLLAIVFGSIMGCLIQSIYIILPFMFIRKFSGGYHAKHPIICFIFSILLLFICIKFSMYIIYNKYFLIFTLVAIIIIMIFSPIDHENRRLNKNERQQYKKIARVLVLLFECLVIGSYLINYNKMAVCFSLGIILAAGLQLPCILISIKNK